jgi:hypothetical protein
MNEQEEKFVSLAKSAKESDELPRRKWSGINSITSHRRKPVSTNESLDSGMRRNDDIRSKLQS